MTSRENVLRLIEASSVHADWQAVLEEALSTVDASYTKQLIESSNWLPGIEHLLSAFRRDLAGVRYVLIGESPYPRRESANGIAFFDAAVDGLWSDQGLSKAVNRATSMRNILKTALLAEGLVELDGEGKVTQQSIALIDKTRLVQTMRELFDNLSERGFLMLNATPVLHPQRKPAKEALFWKGFLQRFLQALSLQTNKPISLVLWGKIAEAIESLPASAKYQKLVSEHPYNISFITNPTMQQLFREISILRKYS